MPSFLALVFLVEYFSQFMHSNKSEGTSHQKLLIHVEFTNINSYNTKVIFGNVWTMRNIKVTIWAVWVGIVD